MPQITAPSYAAALQTTPGAHDYRFLGIEFLPATADTGGFDLIDLGDGSSAQNSLSQVPYDLTLDQCYIHTWPDQSFKRGIALNSASTTISNSYIAGFKVDGQDSQAIAGWNGPGPFTITNNYLEAAGENIMFGGAPTSIPNLIPSNITIADNLVTKLLSWDANDPSYAGQEWTVKNLLELKNAQDVTVDGNDFTNNWVDAQTGFAIVMTPRGDQSGGPWVTVSNVTFTNNIVQNTAQGINILGSDDSSQSQIAQNILIQGNSFDDIGTAEWGPEGGVLFQMLAGLNGGSNNVVINDNTATACRVIISASGVHTGFVFTNNVVPYGEYGVLGTGVGEGTSALAADFPGAVFQGNVILGADPAIYPADNFYGTTTNEKFVIQAYANLLQRPVDAAGMATWTTALAEGASPLQVAQAIENSQEFRAVEVTDLYYRYLHRAPDAAGLNSFTAFLANGGTVEQVAEMMTESPEFFETQGGGTNADFLEALYQDALDRDVDPAGQAIFGVGLDSGVPRAAIVTSIFSSTEFQQDVVENLYESLLNRPADPAGLNAFVAFLSQGGRDEILIAVLVGSPEYTAQLD